MLFAPDGAVRTAAETAHLIAATIGFTSAFLIWLSVVWGIVLRNGWMSTRMRHTSIYATHMTVSIMGLTLAVVHAAAQLMYDETPVRLVDEFVPFTNPGDPIGIGIGVISLYIMLAAAFTTAIQKKLGFARWRALHAMNHVALVLMVGHILISGAEADLPIAWVPMLSLWLFAVVLWVATTRSATSMRSEVGHRMGVTTTRQPDITVDVDPNKCARYGFCEHEAPDVFTLRGDGRLAYRASVPAERADDVIRAVGVCPKRAIHVGRVPTAVLTPQLPDPEEDEAPMTPRGGIPTGPRAVRTPANGTPRATVTGMNRGGRR